VVLAFTVTAVGFAFDAGSGSRELGSVFSACYMLGCLLAVLAVRQSGLFTAVIQPPLLLFVTVPGAYFLFHGAEIHGLKDLAINCGYPLIERFPLMFFTSAAILLIGMGRWYVGMSSRRATATSAAAAKGATKDVPKGASTAAAAGGLVAALKTKVAGLLGVPPGAGKATDDGQAKESPRRRRSSERPRRAAKPAAERTPSSRDAARGAAARKPAERTATPSRSRHNRPPEIIEPLVGRPRRSRSTPRTSESPEPRRRSRAQAPREAREPRETRDARKLPPRERPSSSYGPERRPERSRRLDDYESYEPESYEPLEPRTRNGSSSHHPISRVRYRGADEDDQRSEYRSRPRARRSWDADAWEYDV
jgi:hypothetical protein